MVGSFGFRGLGFASGALLVTCLSALLQCNALPEMEGNRTGREKNTPCWRWVKRSTGKGHGRFWRDRAAHTVLGVFILRSLNSRGFAV